MTATTVERLGRHGGTPHHVGSHDPHDSPPNKMTGGATGLDAALARVGSSITTFREFGRYAQAQWQAWE
ncbi:hypothetical protein [Streptomyces mirabilis]